MHTRKLPRGSWEVGVGLFPRYLTAHTCPACVVPLQGTVLRTAFCAPSSPPNSPSPICAPSVRCCRSSSQPAAGTEAAGQREGATALHTQLASSEMWRADIPPAVHACAAPAQQLFQGCKEDTPLLVPVTILKTIGCPRLSTESSPSRGPRISLWEGLECSRATTVSLQPDSCL